MFLCVSFIGGKPGTVIKWMRVCKYEYVNYQLSQEARRCNSSLSSHTVPCDVGNCIEFDAKSKQVGNNLNYICKGSLICVLL